MRANTRRGRNNMENTRLNIFEKTRENVIVEEPNRNENFRLTKIKVNGTLKLRYLV